MVNVRLTHLVNILSFRLEVPSFNPDIDDFLQLDDSDF